MSAEVTKIVVYAEFVTSLVSVAGCGVTDSSCFWYVDGGG